MRAFVRLSRPLFLYGGFAGVALGAAVARWSGHRLDWAEYGWAQLMVSSFHLMVHYANDYYDRESDIGAVRTRWSGGSGVLVEGHLAPRVAFIAALLCAALGLAAALRFALSGHPLVAVLGVAILVLAWGYSAPPLRFATRGLGEIDTALVVAVLFPFAGYATFASTIDATIAGAVVAPALGIVTMMLCVELPDADCDVRAGKRNLVVRFGTAAAWRLAALSATFALALAIAQVLHALAPLTILALVPAAAAAFVLVVRVRRRPRPGATAFWGVALYATLVTGLVAAYSASTAWGKPG